MIESFLDPHPDEVLYSAWARLGELSRYRNQYDFMRDLFGTANALPIVEMPGHLGYFLENLPRWHSYTLDTLINQYTLYPLYAPFLPEDRLRRLREQMISGNADFIHQLVGKLGIITSSPPWLRYCPTCVEEDRAEYGECYWHRLHQVIGVEVCLRHATFLEESSGRTRAGYMMTRAQFLTADRPICARSAPKVTPPPINAALLRPT